MAHRCTNCHSTYENGSEEILTGCSSCGNNKFKFVSVDGSRATQQESPNTSPSPSAPASKGGASEGSDETPIIVAEDTPTDEQTHVSDQPSSSSVTPPESGIPWRGNETEDENEDGDGKTAPSLEELREHLSEQFGSIKVVSPGTYELDLVELYETQDYIIELQEDGRYIIQPMQKFSID